MVRRLITTYAMLTPEHRRQITEEIQARRAARIAAGLRRLGVGRGDRVAVMLANSPAALALLLGLAKSGAVWVPLNVQLRADGLRYILDHAEPRMVIARADLIPLIRGCGASLATATLVAEGEVEGVAPLASLAAGPAGFDEELPRKLGEIFKDWEGRRLSVEHYQVLADLSRLATTV